MIKKSTFFKVESLRLGYTPKKIQQINLHFQKIIYILGLISFNNSKR